MQWNSLSRPQTCLPGRNIPEWIRKVISVQATVLFITWVLTIALILLHVLITLE